MTTDIKSELTHWAETCAQRMRQFLRTLPYPLHMESIHMGLWTELDNYIQQQRSQKKFRIFSQLCPIKDKNSFELTILVGMIRRVETVRKVYTFCIAPENVVGAGPHLSAIPRDNDKVECLACGHQCRDREARGGVCPECGGESVELEQAVAYHEEAESDLSQQ